MFKQIELKYNFNELEPHIDELTMNTHYSKHHAAYTNNLNSAIEKLPEFSEFSIEKIFTKLSDIYFAALSPNGGGKPEGKLAEQIDKDFGSFEALKEQLSAAAAARFGSGWAWLSADKNGNLKVSSSPNQDNPLMESKGEWTPILGIDVWEHAYYLKYKNLRADYVKAFFEVVDWKEVADNYSKA